MQSGHGGPRAMHHFPGLHLPENHRGQQWVDYDFSGRNLRGFDFSHADLTGSTFAGSDLRGANFTNANLTCADLSNADVAGAEFTNACLDGTVAEGVEFSALQRVETDFRAVAE